MNLAVSILGIINDQEKINKLDLDSVKYIHLDVMDGRFVENIKLPDNQIIYHKPVDIHLMAYDIDKYLTYYQNLDINNITFHYEIGDVLNNINLIKSHNIKVGIAINPKTSINEILPYLDKIDLLLIMSVEPGKGGQPFIEDTIDKINYFNDYRKLNNLNYLIEVDGGINDKIIKKLNADIIVVGNYITAANNYQDQIVKLVKE